MIYDRSHGQAYLTRQLSTEINPAEERNQSKFAKKRYEEMTSGVGKPIAGRDYDEEPFADSRDSIN